MTRDTLRGQSSKITIHQSVCQDSIFRTKLIVLPLCYLFIVECNPIILMKNKEKHEFAELSSDEDEYHALSAEQSSSYSDPSSSKKYLPSPLISNANLDIKKYEQRIKQAGFIRRNKFEGLLKVWVLGSNGQSALIEVNYGMYKLRMNICFLAYQLKEIKREPVNEGSYGIVELFSIKGQKYAVKIIKLDKEEIQITDLYQTIKEVFLLKFAHCLEASVRYQNPHHYDLIVYKDTVQFVMEYSPMHISSQCSKQQQLQKMQNHSQKADIQKDLEHCLSVMHAFGLVHLDIKPDNITYCNSLGRYVFIDWGFSKFVEEDSTSLSLTKFVGSLAFTSPEMKKRYFLEDQAYVNLYENDVHCLKQSVKNIDQNGFFLNTENLKLLPQQNVVSQLLILKKDEEVWYSISLLLLVKRFLFQKKYKKIQDLLKFPQILAKTTKFMLEKHFYFEQRENRNIEISQFIGILDENQIFQNHENRKNSKADQIIYHNMNTNFYLSRNMAEKRKQYAIMRLKNKSSLHVWEYFQKPATANWLFQILFESYNSFKGKKQLVQKIYRSIKDSKQSDENSKKVSNNEKYRTLLKYFSQYYAKTANIQFLKRIRNIYLVLGNTSEIWRIDQIIFQICKQQMNGVFFQHFKQLFSQCIVFRNTIYFPYELLEILNKQNSLEEEHLKELKHRFSKLLLLRIQYSNQWGQSTIQPLPVGQKDGYAFDYLLKANISAPENLNRALIALDAIERMMPTLSFSNTQLLNIYQHFSEESLMKLKEKICCDRMLLHDPGLFPQFFRQYCQMNPIMSLVRSSLHLREASNDEAEEISEDILKSFAESPLKILGNFSDYLLIRKQQENQKKQRHFWQNAVSSFQKIELKQFFTEKNLDSLSIQHVYQNIYRVFTIIPAQRIKKIKPIQILLFKVFPKLLRMIQYSQKQHLRISIQSKIYLFILQIIEQKIYGRNTKQNKKQLDFISKVQYFLKGNCKFSSQFASQSLLELSCSWMLSQQSQKQLKSMIFDCQHQTKQISKSFFHPLLWNVMIEGYFNHKMYKEAIVSLDMISEKWKVKNNEISCSQFKAFYEYFVINCPQQPLQREILQFILEKPLSDIQRNPIFTIFRLYYLLRMFATWKSIVQKRRIIIQIVAGIPITQGWERHYDSKLLNKINKVFQFPQKRKKLIVSHKIMMLSYKMNFWEAQFGKSKFKTTLKSSKRKNILDHFYFKILQIKKNTT